jgi:Rrf2 family protein
MARSNFHFSGEAVFSQTTEYALRAVVYLASQGREPRTLQQVAAATRVQPDYLSKVLQGLRRAQLVQSQRGLGGGFTLSVAPETLSVYDVVQAVDPIRRIRSCPLGIKDHINLCPLHRRLDQALDMVETALKQSSIAELLAEPAQERGIPIPLCSWPADPGRERPG